MARHEYLSVGELEAERILGSDVFRRKIYLDPTYGSDGNDGLSLERAVRTLSYAKSKMESGRNDAIAMVPGSSGLSLPADPAWSLNCASLIGLAPEAMMNQRSRIGMSTTFSPFITVSGYGNLFKNLYTVHGTAVTDEVGWLISGARNAFHNVHFGGPMNAAQGGGASYIGVNITGAEQYFKRCVFGTSTIGRDEVSPNVKIAPPGRHVFEDCLFQVYLTDGDPVFMEVDNSDTVEAFFIRCKFVALNANWATPMTKAFNITGGATAGLYFDNDCQFYNVTALAAADKDQFIFLPRAFATTTDTEGLIAVPLAI